MATGRPPADLVALQARVDQVARELLDPPTWVGQIPEVRVDPRVAGGNRALASARHGRALIRISPGVAAEPEEYLRGTLAHEAGHIALGHQRAAHAGWTLAIGIPLWAAAIGSCIVGIQHSTTQQTSLWFGLALIPALLALRLIVIPSRRSELAADQWSSKLIGTAAVLRTLHHLDTQCSPLTRLAAGLGMDTHPTPRQRARHLLRTG